MTRRVVVCGVGMVPFKKPGQSDSYDVMGAGAAMAALADSTLEYKDIDQAFASYVYGDSCAGQAALYRVGITGIPITNVNNNCASGSTAFALAAQAVEYGVSECVMALGFEQMPKGAIEMAFPHMTSPLQRHTDALADLVGASEEERKLPPAVMMFGCQAEIVMDEYSISEQAMAQIAVKSRNHAEHNPYAIYRDPLTVEQILEQPPLYRGLRKLFACPPSCGAASVIVCSEEFAKKHNLDIKVVLKGSGWCSDKAEYFESNPLDITFRALSKEAANQAYNKAGVSPDDIDVIELHDCFTSNEIITYSALGLCSDSDIEKFIMEGDNTYGGKFVVCPSGGLLAKGHPLGATGLSQITELVQQLRGQSGVRQVDGARLALQHNGGLGSAGFVNIFERV
ncbi:thiolase C-terminal domain-containing protein [Thalassomonas sp. M1454]|uniref:thiolase C-terminal domain-containing protein n=1 Tax=Thalassomonas sp. M1454 TaxID=2594477 RepID=UPI00118095AD|nr:lipid-transfer protein [Thalassomonas sp. M1454]TRX56519.1 lipid-transfer protein [Thalassomonas sp. M1454]